MRDPGNHTTSTRQPTHRNRCRKCGAVWTSWSRQPCPDCGSSQINRQEIPL